MAALEEDQDDVVINPATMLLRDDDSDEVKTAESEQLRQHSLPSIDSTIVTRQLPSQGLSFQLWPAATTLLTLLDDHRSDPATSPLGPTLSALESGRRLKILELGSGTGLVGIAAAATLGACVTVTDLPHVVDNLKFNAELNAAVLGGSGGSVSVAALRWGEAEDAEAIGREFDIVLASDVVYHDHLYEPLLKTLSFLLLGEGRVVFVMAHLRRWKKESAFFKRARKLFEVEVLHVDRPCQGSRVGVTVYRFTGKPSVGERSIFHLYKQTNQNDSLFSNIIQHK
ncbi:protein N-lysine methyltransferase METTL21A [Rosa sericea]